ncbi:MAG: class I SAM-dependent methyltransferase [Proteobacteria bacterium]|nr:class I SAM-dependent methyltransferase [Pseudomonadota bacterium]MBU1716406.1 class I SAM-dependent methyltransferase [Pseudomonadota bacterium]
MIKKYLYNLLGHPFIYRLSQIILAPGAEIILTKKIQDLAKKFPASGRIIDVGCGPSSWLWQIKMLPVGLDISYQYSVNYHRQANLAVTGSAISLPILTETFDGIWCIGVLHHLPDQAAKEAINEMLRICQPGGHVIIMDAVLPKKSWLRLIATMIRRMDRGEFIRSQQDLSSLLPDEVNWSISRYTYAMTGLEMLECTYRKPLSVKK